MQIEKSVCGQYVRITIGDRSIQISMAEWSRRITMPGQFIAAPNRVVLA